MMDNPFVDELNLPKESLHLWIPLESYTSITSYLMGSLAYRVEAAVPCKIYFHQSRN